MKDEINNKNCTFISIKGGKIMEAILERDKMDCSTRKTRGKTCEIYELMKMNEEIVRKNGFSKSDVKKIVNEVCGRNVRSYSRY